TLLLNYGQVAKDIRNTMQICGRPYLQERPKKVKYNAIYMGTTSQQPCLKATMRCQNNNCKLKVRNWNIKDDNPLNS
ncbi:unnamed protein product, partial [Sphagnum compactum]